jgi:MFS family permease
MGVTSPQAPLTTASTNDSDAQTPTDIEKNLEKSKTDEHRAPLDSPSVNATTPGLEKVYTSAKDWDGPDDKGNPRNWPIWKRAYHSGVTALLSFVVTYGTSAYSPGISKVAEDLNVSEEVAVLGLSLYVLGLAFGPVVAGGMSETFGRKAVYIWCTPIALLFTLGAGLSKNITSLLITRFFAGVTGSGPLAVGSGTTADVWEPIDWAAAASLWILAPFLGPALGPATAGYPIQKGSWRWGQWLLLCAGGFAWLFALFQQETYKKVILRNRAKKYGLPPPHDPLPPGFAKVKALFNVTVLRALRMLFTEPICTAFAVYCSFTFGVLFAFFPGVTWVYRTVYGFSVGQAGLVFIAIGVGCILGTGVFIFIDRVTYRPQALRLKSEGSEKSVPPEERLYSAMLGAVLLPISLFWFAWSARSDVHWIVPTIALAFFGAGNQLVFDTAATYLTSVYGPMGSASAMSANNLARYACGAAFPLFAVQMFRDLTIKWAGSLLGFVTIALLPIPFLFYKFGKRIRSKGSIPKSDA